MVGKHPMDAAVGGAARHPLAVNRGLSPFGGVWMTAPGKYVAEIIDPSEKRRVCLGTFDTEEEAVKTHRREVRRARRAFVWKDFVKQPLPKSSGESTASEDKKEVGEIKVPFDFDLNLPAPLD